MVRSSFYSHVHQEMIQVERDILEKKPIGMNFIVGSTTTYQGKPPSFNVVYLDPETMLPVDYETYAFDLELANSKDEVVWRKMYDYREAYGIDDLSPKSFLEFAVRMYRSESETLEYKKRMWVGGPGSGDPAYGCDYKCRLQAYCWIVAGDYEQYQFCRDKSKHASLSGNLLTDILAHNWYLEKDQYENSIFAKYRNATA